MPVLSTHVEEPSARETRVSHTRALSAATHDDLMHVQPSSSPAARDLRRRLSRTVSQDATSTGVPNSEESPDVGAGPRLRRSTSFSQKSAQVLQRLFGVGRKKEKTAREDARGIGVYPAEFHVKVRKLTLHGVALPRDARVCVLGEGTYVGKVTTAVAPPTSTTRFKGVVLDVATELVGDLAKQTFIDKRLLLTFVLVEEEARQALTETPLARASLSLVDLLSLDAAKSRLERRHCTCPVTVVLQGEGGATLSGELSYSCTSLRGDKLREVTTDALTARQIEYKRTLDVRHLFVPSHSSAHRFP